MTRQIERSALLTLFGLSEKAKLPRAGMMQYRTLAAYPGWMFWIRPLAASRKRGKTHRLMACHSDCGQVMSAGRIGQHVCAPAAPLVQIPTPTTIEEVKELIG